MVLGLVGLPELAPGFLEIAHHPLVGAHVAQDPDRPDDCAVRIPEGRSIERRRDDLARSAAWVEPDVAGDAAFHHLTQRGDELAGLLGRDDARQRLLDHLVGTEPQQREDGVVRLQDLPSQIAHEDGVRGVLDEAFGIGAGLVQLPHVAEDADDTDGMPGCVAQRRCIQRRRDDFARRAAGIEAEVPRHSAVDDLADRGDELLGFRRAEEARERLFEDLVAAQTEQLRDCFIRLQDLSAQIGNENRVGGVCDNDIGRKGAANVTLQRRISAQAADHDGQNIFIVGIGARSTD